MENADAMPTPNLFLVGAPKCGTTSLYEYLRQHPQIFFPSDKDDYWRAKEPNHLCPELDILPKYSIKSREEYLNLYRGSDPFKWRGDASPYYLASSSSPERIKQLSYDARILIMLRPPVDMMRSYHRDLLRIGLEEREDFFEAIRVGNRKDGIPVHEAPPGVPGYLDYNLISQFAQQVERYQMHFGKDSTKVVLLEEMASDPESTFKEILEFLEVDASFVPEFKVHNETPRNGPLERSIKFIYRQPVVHHIIGAVIPYRARHKMLSLVRNAEDSRTRLDPRDAQLRKLHAMNIEHLSRLIGKDLSHWQTAS